ncbi:MAG: ribonuclease P protein component [Bacteroidales bacterium]|nr:ribonuclease P protein component [Bacteroidales bacterium]
MSETLPKSERLSGQTGVSALFSHGKSYSHGCLRCKVLPRTPVMPGPDRASALPAPDENYFSGQCPKNQFSSGIASLTHADASRIVVSVPKRLFKRAVKRNLLKRRIREAYRRQKGLLSAPMDILFIYSAPEVLPYEAIFADMTALLTELSQNPGAQVVDI